MFKSLFEGNALLDLPVVTLLGFFAAFCGIVAWAFLRRRAADFDTVSQLPLADDDVAILPRAEQRGASQD